MVKCFRKCEGGDPHFELKKVMSDKQRAKLDDQSEPANYASKESFKKYVKSEYHMMADLNRFDLETMDVDLGEALAMPQIYTRALWQFSIRYPATYFSRYTAYPRALHDVLNLVERRGQIKGLEDIYKVKCVESDHKYNFGFQFGSNRMVLRMRDWVVQATVDELYNCVNDIDY